MVERLNLSARCRLCDGVLVLISQGKRGTCEGCHARVRKAAGLPPLPPAEQAVERQHDAERRG